MIFADANVIPAHLVFFAVRGRDGRQTVRVQRHSRGRAAAIHDAATGSGDPATAGTADDEAHRNARRAVLSAARDAGATDRRASEAAGKVRAEIGRLHSRFGVRDRKACAEKARGAHAGAWADGRMRGAIAVRRIIKEGHRKDASMPTPEKNKGDFVILSTAAYWAARGHKARLPAFDRDLAAFSIAIRERLGVDVVDCGRLGQQ